MSVTVSFTDASTPGPSGPITGWAWDFGDSGTSTAQNPVYTYAADGTYTVGLTVTSPDGTDNITRSVRVGATGGSLSADFTDSVAGLTVTFTDTSIAGPSGPITGWAWDFGDGATSTSQNPSHTYAAAGTYTRTLTVTGTSPDGTSTVSTGVTLGTSFFSVTSLARPAFTPLRTIGFTTKLGLDNAIAGMQAGDLIQYTGGSPLVIAAPYTISGKNPASAVVIDFRVPATTAMTNWGAPTTSNYVKFAYTGTSKVDAFTISNCSNLRLYGGEFSSGNYGNCAIRLWGPAHDLDIWDAYTSMSGGHGIQVVSKTISGTNSLIYNLNMRLEVNQFAMNPAVDGHADKGSGLHAVELHGGGTTRDCTIICYGHDSLQPGATSAGKTWPEGGGCSVVEPGMDTPGVNYNFTIYALGENLKFIPNGTNPGSTGSGQTGGNVIAAWGNAPLNNYEFPWIQGINCTGTVFHCASAGTWHPGSPAIHVSHGRHTTMNQYTGAGNGSPNNVPYPSGFGIVYDADCI